MIDRRSGRLRNAGALLLFPALWLLASCASDPGAAQAMQDHQEQRKQVQKEQDFAKALPPTDAKPVYQP